MLRKKQVPKVVRPTKEECLEILGLDSVDLSFIRSIKLQGLKKFCEDKLEGLASPEEKQESGSPFSIFASKVYSHFRSEYKEKGPQWKHEPILMKDFISQLIEQEELPDEEAIEELVDLVSQLYIIYVSRISKTEQDE